MKLSLPAVMAFVAVFASAQQPQAPNSSTASVSWGSAVNGLRLGVAFGPDPSEPTIRVVFQNVSGQDQDVLIGYQIGRNPAYNLKFIAKAPDGKLREGHELAAGPTIRVDGLVKPVSLALSTVRKYEIAFPLKNIVYSSQTDTLEGLLKAGYTVRVSLEAGEGEPSMATLPHPWVGKVESAEISSAR